MQHSVAATQHRFMRTTMYVAVVLCCSTVAAMVDKLIANADAGPQFFLLGALLPTGKCMDDDDIRTAPDVWQTKASIVRLYTAGMTLAHDRGFHLNILTDRHGAHLIPGTIRNKIPDWYVLDPDSWPAQGYLSRFLAARAQKCKDVSMAHVQRCTYLRDQLGLISKLPGWPAMSSAGVTVRSFMEATMHIVQLHFFRGKGASPQPTV
jgi:hypothetical protein